MYKPISHTSQDWSSRCFTAKSRVLFRARWKIILWFCLFVLSNVKRVTCKPSTRWINRNVRNSSGSFGISLKMINSVRIERNLRLLSHSIITHVTSTKILYILYEITWIICMIVCDTDERRYGKSQR